MTVQHDPPPIYRATQERPDGEHRISTIRRIADAIAHPYWVLPRELHEPLITWQARAVLLALAISEEDYGYRVLITGSRNWLAAGTVVAVLDRLLAAHPALVVVHGACPTGADRIAGEWCEELGVPAEGHPADWATHGRAAGPRRNAEMVATAPAECHAFIRAGSAGATDCAKKAEQAGIPTTRHEVD